MKELWIVVEFEDNGKTRKVGKAYETWEEACEVQEAMETLHDDKSYLIYTEDEWQWNEQTGWY